MKIDEKCFVVFRDNKQISYHKLQSEIQSKSKDAKIKEVEIDPLNSTLTPDSNDNIIINTKQFINKQIKKTKIMMGKEYFKMC